MLVRTIVSTLLKTTTLNSVKGRFPSASPTCGKVSDVLLLRRIAGLLERRRCRVKGVSTAVVTRGPGVTPRVPRVETGVTGTVKVGRSRLGVGTAARRGLKFAKERRKVTSRTVYLLGREGRDW